VKRLSGNRFAESRRQLACGEFEIDEFIKGKNPKPQRKVQSFKKEQDGTNLLNTKPGGPVNRTRGVRPPMNANRGALGGPPGRGRGRGGRGHGGIPIRGEFNQSNEPVDIIQPTSAPESALIDEQEQFQNADKIEEPKQQPAIQIPIENKKEETRIELEPEIDHNTQIVNPPVTQEDKDEPIVNQTEEITEDIQDSPTNLMPKTSSRRKQPQPGNHNAQPPAMASRGRGGGRGGPARGRGGRPPNMGARPIPPIVQDKPRQTIEIEEDEIVHEDEQKIEEAHEPKLQESQPKNEVKKQSDDNLSSVENK
jgi:hypothetical protein